MTPSPTELLDQSEAILHGPLTLRGHSNRASAWLARSALEAILADLVRAGGCDPGEANTRSLLVCIQVLYEVDRPELAGNAQYAWDRLSQAAHHHAYELGPTADEVAHLVGLVRDLAADVPAARGRSPRPDRTVTARSGASG